MEVKGTSIVDTNQLAQVSKTIKYSVKDVLAQSISRAESIIAYNFFSIVCYMNSNYSRYSKEQFLQ